MTRTTFNEIKGDIARVASSAGLTVSDDRVKMRTNSIQTRLGFKGDWHGVFDTVAFTIYDRVVTLPMAYQKVTHMALSGNVMPVMPQWYEFISSGPGPQDKLGWVDVFASRGLSPVVRQSNDTPRRIQAYSYADETVEAAVPTIRILGYDENGNWVRSDASGTWEDGIRLDLNGHLAVNYTTSDIYFSRITRVIKPRTNERVELYWLDDDDVTTHFAAKYEYSETTPMYEQFAVPCMPFADPNAPENTAYTVEAVCRRSIQKIVTGDEELLFDNIEAFRLGMIALAKEESSGIQESAYLWNEAKQCLIDEYVSANGSSSAAPSLNVVGDNGLNDGPYDIF